jgi:hypothetical protein
MLPVSALPRKNASYVIKLQDGTGDCRNVNECSGYYAIELGNIFFIVASYPKRNSLQWSQDELKAALAVISGRKIREV